jgi:chromosome partitioning protein
MSFITVANYKGGVSKTTTAVHLAAFLQAHASTLLIDGDQNRSVIDWSKRGKLPFSVCDEKQGAYEARHFEHVVIDTQARPHEADLQDLARGCDLLVIPVVPATLDMKATAKMLHAVHQFAVHKYRVLITKAPPYPQRDAPELREELAAAGIPMFAAEIPLLKVFEHAAAAGVPVYDVKNPQAERAWAAYESAGKEIMRWLQKNASSRASLASS